jgi:hypothetical protein
MTTNHDRQPEQEIPVFNSWPAWYSAVLLFHSILIFLFYLLMKVFN